MTSLGLRMGSHEASKEMRQVTDYLRPLCVLMSSAFWIGCCNSRRGTRPGWQEKTVGKERSTPGWRGKLLLGVERYQKQKYPVYSGTS